MDGVELNFENIASYKYPGARPLFFYVKTDHVGVIPGMREFINEFVSEKAMGKMAIFSQLDLCRCQMMTLRNRSLREMLYSLRENLQLPSRVVSLTAGWFSL